MNALDRLLPTPRLLESDHVDLAAEPGIVFERVRHGDLATAPFVRALFALRTLPDRLAGRTEPVTLRIDALSSSPARPGFQVLVDDPPLEVAVGAIGKVWKGEIPFVHVSGPEGFASFVEPGFIKVAWAMRVSPRATGGSHLALEVRVDATDETSWKKFRRYFRFIGPASRLIRRSALAALARELGSPDALRNERALPGDDLLPDAVEQLTHGIDIAARPEAIWPWLIQMGCRRAGYYSLDLLDNEGERSFREIHPELQRLAVGEVIPATRQGNDGFEVLRIDEPRALILGGLFDAGAKRQLSFFAARPERFLHMTWAFVLEPRGDASTRLEVRVRGALHDEGRLYSAWIRPVHHLMETAQLNGLKQRAEGTLAPDDWHDVLEGVGGAALMAASLLTPFLNEARSRWGLTPAEAARSLPGDGLVRKPRWSWTHGIEIEAPAAEVWPFVIQIGAGRGGFYSYQWLENLVGCGVENAEVPRSDVEHPLRVGDPLSLHPGMPPLRIVELVDGRALVASAPLDAAARDAGKPWAEASWAFVVEPLGERRCRLLSRFRVDCSEDLPSRLSLGPGLLGPIGFAMDRRMLLGLKRRAEGMLSRREEDALRFEAAGARASR